VSNRFRNSEFVDFNTGTVKLAPIQLKFRLTLAGPLLLPDLIRLFHCRMEVWYLGVAAQMLNEIEFTQPPTIWSHAAYSLLALMFAYFEMIGKILNASAVDEVVTAADFDCGFRDVYSDTLGEVRTSSGELYDPKEFYRRARNGLYQLGSTQWGLWVHNIATISPQDFDIVQRNSNDPASIRYYVNPHTLVRTIIDHFPTLIERLNDPDVQYDPLRERFIAYFGDIREL
jgi:hypothetical protein